MATTLRKLLEEHPEWADLPIAIGREDGAPDYVGDSAWVDTAHDNWDDDTDGELILLFDR